MKCLGRCSRASPAAGVWKGGRDLLSLVLVFLLPHPLFFFFCNNNRKRGRREKKKSPAPPRDAALLKKVTISHLKKQQREPGVGEARFEFQCATGGMGSRGSGRRAANLPAKHPTTPFHPSSLRSGPKYSSQQAPCIFPPKFPPICSPGSALSQVSARATT